MSATHWKVGELAARTGLTVRTLHHYDSIGLLSPSLRTGAGHRLYTAADVARLQQIVSLKQLGFGLDEIGAHLDHPDFDPRRVLKRHLERSRGQADELKRLMDRLEALSRALDTAEVVSAEQFLAVIQETTMLEKYYTPEQLEQLRKRRDEGGPELEQQIADAPRLWAEYHADLQAAMDSGTAPESETGQALARRWWSLIRGFTGGDPGIFGSLNSMYRNEDSIRGMDVKAMRPGQEWIAKAAKAAGIEVPSARHEVPGVSPHEPGTGPIRRIVRGGKVEVNLPDGTEVIIVPETAEAALAPAEIAAIAGAMPPFEWTAADEAEWQAEKAAKGVTS